MIDLLFLAVFQVAAGDPAPAPAEQTETVAAEATAPATEVQEPTVHRRCWTEQVTGTRFGRRVCETRDQAVERERDTREMVQDMQQASTGPMRR